MDFLPPSVKVPVPRRTETHYSAIPDGVESSEHVILGVDEAGRGPVLGPMVYGVAYIMKSKEHVLKQFGFDDSKKLTETKRTELMQGICGSEAELKGSVGWATTSITARDIGAGMLRPTQSNYNLNSQAHDVTMALIDGVLQRGVPVKQVFVDTVGPPAKYQQKLQLRFPQLEITVTKKADSLFPIVSAASIVAKVTRDYTLQECARACGQTWGSGYPSDPRTKKWLAGSVDPLFGWDHNIRYSWQTAKDAMKNNGAIAMAWEHELVEKPTWDDRPKPATKIGCEWWVCK